MAFIESLSWEYSDKVCHLWVGGSRLLCTRVAARAHSGL